MPTITASENLAILLTPPGVGAIAVVRLRGPAGFLQLYFSKAAMPGRCVHGQLRDGQTVIDDAVVVAIDAETVDLCLHGGAWTVKVVMDLAQRAGFTITQDIQAGMDGEDILEREMLSAIPLARTPAALRLLLAQTEAWRDALRTEINAAAILEDRSLWWMLHPPHVAIVGSANVGKSTLANQLFAQERSITADVPGTTRDWLGEIANLDDLAVMLLDTPGIRATEDPIEQQAISQSRRVIETSDLVLLVLDASRPLEGEQGKLIDLWPRAIRVIDQIDRPQAWDVNGMQGVKTVATRGEGIDHLREQIRRHFGIKDMNDNRARWWTPRQRDILNRAINNREILGEFLA